MRAFMVYDRALSITSGSTWAGTLLAQVVFIAGGVRERPPISSWRTRQEFASFIGKSRLAAAPL
jgi:hypothetical protein